MHKVAARADIASFHVMDVLSAANRRLRTHGDMVSLALGQPPTGAPQPVRAAAAEALGAQTLGYTEQLGIPALRAAIAGHYRRSYAVDIDADDVVVTTGSSGGLMLALLAAFDAGDRVALARPGYPAYRNILRALGCEVVELPTDETTRFQPTVAMLDAAGPLDGVILASPSNPTGTVIDPAEIALWCADRGVRLISDEIYHGITYGTRASTAWQHSRDAIVVNSFSKYFSMTGWRLGWLVVPERLRRAVDRLTGNFTLCPPALSQHAAVAAFTDESYAEVDGHVARYAANRDLLLTGLKDIGIDRVAPVDGGFTAWADISHLTDDSMAWCGRLLDDTGVAVAPGVDFDPVLGNRFVRFSFAGATDDIAEGVRRIGAWLELRASAQR